MRRCHVLLRSLEIQELYLLILDFLKTSIGSDVHDPIKSGHSIRFLSIFAKRRRDCYARFKPLPGSNLFGMEADPTERHVKSTSNPTRLFQKASSFSAVEAKIVIQCLLYRLRGIEMLEIITRSLFAWSWTDKNGSAESHASHDANYCPVEQTTVVLPL